MPLALELGPMAKPLLANHALRMNQQHRGCQPNDPTPYGFAPSDTNVDDALESERKPVGSLLVKDFGSRHRGGLGGWELGGG